jgi:hypothetical protein
LCGWEPRTSAEEHARGFMPRRSHAHRLSTILGNLTDDRRKIERAPPGRTIPRAVSGEHCGEGFVHRHMPHTVRSLPWFASPLASHPGLRTVRHGLCCAVASHSCAMGYDYVGSALPCHGVVGLLSIPFLLAVPFDRRLIWFSDCYESDSAPLRSRLPSGSKRFHEWRRSHTAADKYPNLNFERASRGP